MAYEFESDYLKVHLSHAATIIVLSGLFATVELHHASCCYLALKAKIGADGERSQSYDDQFS